MFSCTREHKMAPQDEINCRLESIKEILREDTSLLSAVNALEKARIRGSSDSIQAKRVLDSLLSH